ncbi:hypothetical protein ACFOPQ_04860 [Deinococcus antarcticus]|uniref:Major facilitator superfamily (MFS) profile domain-containing protein n=1 Tax=Deinococcus antarcticus TaxID=1298767 RepID=A0ABV8A6P4_9DEIO
MNSTLRNLLAFLLGCAGVALAFWGVLEGTKLHHVLGLLSVPLGVVLLVAAFRLSPTE